MGFFSAAPNNLIFENFSFMHVLSIAFLVVSVALLIIFRNKIAKWKYEKYFLYSITALAIVFEITFRLWIILTNEITLFSECLPFDLCSLTLILACILCFAPKKRWMFILVYFYSMGSIASIIFPGLCGFGADHFRFYHFFYTHIYIVFVAMYFSFVRKYKITFKGFAYSSLVLFLLSGIMLIFNYILDANFMYLMHKPHFGSPLDILGEWPDYVYVMSLTVIFVLFLAYLPWIIINWRRKRKNSK